MLHGKGLAKNLFEVPSHTAAVCPIQKFATQHIIKMSIEFAIKRMIIATSSSVPVSQCVRLLVGPPDHTGFESHCLPVRLASISRLSQSACEEGATIMCDCQIQ